MKALMFDLVKESRKGKEPKVCTTVELCKALGLNHTDMTKNMRSLLVDHFDLCITSEEVVSTYNHTPHLIYHLPPMAVLLIVSRMKCEQGVAAYKLLLKRCNPDLTPNPDMFEYSIRNKSRITRRKKEHLQFIGADIKACANLMREVLESVSDVNQAANKVKRVANR